MPRSKSEPMKECPVCGKWFAVRKLFKHIQKKHGVPYDGMSTFRRSRPMGYE